MAGLGNLNSYRPIVSSSLFASSSHPLLHSLKKVLQSLELSGRSAHARRTYRVMKIPAINRGAQGGNCLPLSAVRSRSSAQALSHPETVYWRLAPGSQGAEAPGRAEASATHAVVHLQSPWLAPAIREAVRGATERKTPSRQSLELKASNHAAHKSLATTVEARSPGSWPGRKRRIARLGNRPHLAAWQGHSPRSKRESRFALRGRNDGNLGIQSQSCLSLFGTA